MSEGHDHTHENVNGSETEQPIYFPPAELMLQDLRNDYAQKCIENYELLATARFQARLIENLQAQMGEMSAELSKLKGDSSETEPEIVEADI